MGSNKNKITGRITYNNKPTYTEFSNTSKHVKSGLDISYEEYKKIISESNLEISNIILENELGFKLPLNIGYIAVTKFKQKDNYIVTDWANTRKFNKVIPQLNFHSMGHMYKIKLFKNNKLVPFRVYFMQAHRSLKRRLAAIIKKGKSNYLNLDNSYFTSKFNINKIFKNKL